MDDFFDFLISTNQIENILVNDKEKEENNKEKVLIKDKNVEKKEW